MQIMVTGRQMGKTTTVLSHLYAFDDSVLVVATNQRAQQLKLEHPEIAHRIVSATGSAGLRGYNYGRVYVDDVDMVLYHLLGAPVSLATATADLIEIDEPEDSSNEVVDIVVETYNDIAGRIESINSDIAEKLAADVAREVASWHLSSRYPED